MSLTRDVLRRRLHELRPPLETDVEDIETEELRDAFSHNDMYLRSALSRQRRPMTESSRAYAAGADSVVKASDCFETVLEVQLPNCASSRFRVYYTAPKPTSDRDSDESKSVCFVCHHGAGYSGLSFALFAKTIREASGGSAGVLALDCRGHGKTQHPHEYEVSLANLAEDLVGVLGEVFPSRTSLARFILVGHSMGGAVVVAACDKIQKHLGQVIGVVNLDIVEGSAIDALSSMRNIINARPTEFPTIQDAISWHVQNRTIQNMSSARISVPPLFVTSPGGDSVLWRTDLLRTELCWQGWFTNLSVNFLSCKCAKLLGRFQLTVFTDVGHCLQEDAPDRLALLLYDFYQRNDSTDILKHARKVGQT